MLPPHRKAIAARQMQVQAIARRKTSAALSRGLRIAAANKQDMLQHSLGAVVCTENVARGEIAKHQTASCSTERFGHGCLGRAAAWHVVPNSLPYCIDCFAPHARGVLRCFGWLSQPASGNAAAWSSRQPPRASSTKARPRARFGKTVPNRSVKASPNSWPGLPFLGHFSYRPIQVMPGQLSAPPYLQR